MAKPITVNANKNKRGRPVTTGTGTIVGVRMLDHPLAAVDAWIAKQKESDLSRPEAIRRLVEIGLKSETLSKPIAKPGRRSRAQELARNAIEKIIDPATSPEERAQRRQRLSKGPPEFREDRVDQPKAKR